MRSQRRAASKTAASNYLGSCAAMTTSTRQCPKQEREPGPGSGIHGQTYYPHPSKAPETARREWIIGFDADRERCRVPCTDQPVRIPLQLLYSLVSTLYYTLPRLSIVSAVPSTYPLSGLATTPAERTRQDGNNVMNAKQGGKKVERGLGGGRGWTVAGLVGSIDELLR